MAATVAAREEAATAAMEPACPEGWLWEAAAVGKPTEAGGEAAPGKAGYWEVKTWNCIFDCSHNFFF